MIQVLDSEGTKQTVKKIISSEHPFVECYSLDKYGEKQKLFSPKFTTYVPGSKRFYADKVNGTSMFSFSASTEGQNFIPFRYGENRLGFMTIEREQGLLHFFKDYLDCIHFLRDGVVPVGYESEFEAGATLTSSYDYELEVKTAYLPESKKVYISLYWGHDNVIYSITPSFEPSGDETGELTNWNFTPEDAIMTAVIAQIPYKEANMYLNFEFYEVDSVPVMLIEASIGTTIYVFLFNLSTGKYINKLTRYSIPKYTLINGYLFISLTVSFSSSTYTCRLYRVTGTAFTQLLSKTSTEIETVSNVAEAEGTYFCVLAGKIYYTTAPTGTSWTTGIDFDRESIVGTFSADPNKTPSALAFSADVSTSLFRPKVLVYTAGASEVKTYSSNSMGTNNAIFNVSKAPALDVNTLMPKGSRAEVLKGGTVVTTTQIVTGWHDGRPIYEYVEEYRGYTLDVKLRVAQYGTKTIQTTIGGRPGTTTVTRYRSAIGLVYMNTYSGSAGVQNAEYIGNTDNFDNADIFSLEELKDSYYSSIK